MTYLKEVYVDGVDSDFDISDMKYSSSRFENNTVIRQIIGLVYIYVLARRVVVALYAVWLFLDSNQIFISKSNIHS